jgi:hypothetical protein
LGADKYRNRYLADRKAISRAGGYYNEPLPVVKTKNRVMKPEIAWKQAGSLRRSMEGTRRVEICERRGGKNSIDQ